MLIIFKQKYTGMHDNYMNIRLNYINYTATSGVF